MAGRLRVVVSTTPPWDSLFGHRWKRVSLRAPNYRRVELVPTLVLSEGSVPDSRWIKNLWAGEKSACNRFTGGESSVVGVRDLRC